MSSDKTVDIEFVRVGDPGNEPDESTRRGLQLGAVGYVYDIAKFEMNCTQYVALTRPDLDGCSGRGTSPWAVDVGDATATANLLNELAGYPPAYNYNYNMVQGFAEPWPSDHPDYDAAHPYRSKRAVYFLPSADEWHKAAYYDPTIEGYWDFAVGTNEEPTWVSGNTTEQSKVVGQLGDFVIGEVEAAGGLSSYGTVAQTGNAAEWEERVSGMGEPYFFRSGGELDGTGGFRAHDNRIQVELETAFSTAAIRIVALTERMRPNLLADFDMDSEVGFSDFLTLSDMYGSTVEPGTGADLNSNGEVDFPDFLLLSGAYGQTSTTQAVPEPATHLMLVLGMLATFGLRESRYTSVEV